MLYESRFEDVFSRWPVPMDSALSAFRKSCRKIPTETVLVADKQVAPEAWERSCRLAELPGAEENPEEFFKEAFTPFGAYTQQKTAGLLTGYYEPLLYGSLTPDARFKYPVWGVPKDLNKPLGSLTEQVRGGGAVGFGAEPHSKKARPYLTHRQIDEQGLEGRAEALLYVDDPIELFFLHIQGSGRVELPDGKVVQLGYAGKNGHPYTAIGRILIERREIPAEEMTAQRLKQWLRDHPEQARDIMWQNESYVFFVLRDTDQHPLGAEGVPLTPEASIAVDPSQIPYGTPVFVETLLPALSETLPTEQARGGEAVGFGAEPHSKKNYTRLLIAQDTGGAIKGPLRGDLFFGPGKRAEALAGAMKQSTKFFVLLPK